MIDAMKINLNDIPKIFCDGALCGHHKEGFTFLLTSGEQKFGFASTPTQTKAIIEMFNAQLAEYERKFGVIEFKKGDNQNLIISPIQIEKP